MTAGAPPLAISVCSARVSPPNSRQTTTPPDAKQRALVGPRPQLSLCSLTSASESAASWVPLGESGRIEYWAEAIAAPGEVVWSEPGRRLPGHHGLALFVGVT